MIFFSLTSTAVFVDVQVQHVGSSGIQRLVWDPLKGNADMAPYRWKRGKWVPQMFVHVESIYLTLFFFFFVGKMTVTQGF